MPQIVTVPIGALDTNCYLVYTEGEHICAVIDPGAEPEKIREALQRENLVPGAILLTHGHFDHMGAVDALGQGRIPVYLHPEDKCMLSDGRCNGSETFGLSPVRCFAVTTDVEDGTALTVGNLQFHVLHTPGHSRGSVCYLCEDCLFSGDTMFADGYGRTDLYGGSFDSLRLSLRRVLPYRHSHGIYPGHGEAYREV